MQKQICTIGTIQIQSEYLRLFLDIIKAIAASLDPREVFDLIVTKIPEVVHVDAATIRLPDPSRQKLVLEAASGLSEAYLNRGPIDAEESVLAALAERCGIAIENARIYDEQKRQLNDFKAVCEIGRLLESRVS